jgi:hypothetical protein
MAFELFPRDQPWTPVEFWRPETLLRYAVDGEKIRPRRLVAVAVCTLCGHIEEAHRRFDPQEMNRVPSCRCCTLTSVVPVKLEIKVARTILTPRGSDF